LTDGDSVLYVISIKNFAMRNFPTSADLFPRSMKGVLGMKKNIDTLKSGTETIKKLQVQINKQGITEQEKKLLTNEIPIG
jgi:hypothetical protein